MGGVLRRCLDSVLLNTYTDIEVICVNDGSTDNSLEILKEYEKNDSRMILINQKNYGVSAARNAGLDICSGEYIAFVDSDDWIHPQYFEIMIEAIEQFDGEIVSCQYEKKYDHEFLKPEINNNFFNKHNYSMELMGLNDIMQNHDVKSYIWGKLYKRQVIEKIRFQHCSVSEDKLFNLQVVTSFPNIKLIAIDLKLYFYYQRKDSAVHHMCSESYMPFLRGLATMMVQFDNNERCKDYIVVEALKAGFFIRYCAKFDTNDHGVVREAKDTIHKMTSELRHSKSIKLQEKLQYYILATFPFIYRWGRIYSDKTMLEWEKKQKEGKNASRII